MAATTIASAADAITIVNGSFEQGPSTAGNGYYIELGNSSTAIPGWVVGGNSIDYINPSHPYWVAANGTAALDMSGSAPGAISQTLTTTPGQRYIVSFDMAGNPDGTPTMKTMSVDINGAGTQYYYFDTTGATYSDLGWTVMKYVFVASGTSSVLTFTDHDTGSPYGAALDNVTIAVPEPVSWALMIVGIGGIGGVARASRRGRPTALA